MLSPAPEEASASEESDGDSDEDNKLALQADAEKEAEPEAEAEAVTKKDKKKGKRIRKPKSKQKSEDEVPPPPAVQSSRADDPSSTAKLSQDDAPSSPAQQTPIAVLMEFFPNQPRHVLEEVLVKNSGDMDAATRAGLELPPVASSPLSSPLPPSPPQKPESLPPTASARGGTEGSSSSPPSAAALPKTAGGSSKSKQGHKIFVGGLAPTVTATDLYNFFKKFGSIVDYTVMVEKEVCAVGSFAAHPRHRPFDRRWTNSPLVLHSIRSRVRAKEAT